MELRMKYLNPGRFDSYTYFNPPSHPDDLLFKAVELKENQAIQDQSALKERLGKLHDLPINEGNLGPVAEMYDELKNDLSGLVKGNEALNDPLVSSKLNDKISSFARTPEFLTATMLGSAKKRDMNSLQGADRNQQDYVHQKWKEIDKQPILNQQDPLFYKGVSVEEPLKPQDPEKRMIDYLKDSKLKFKGLIKDGRFILETNSTNLKDAVTGAQKALNPDEQKSLYYKARVMENNNPEYANYIKEIYARQFDKLDDKGKVVKQYPRDKVSLEEAITFDMARQLAPNLMEDKVKVIQDKFDLLSAQNQYKKDFYGYTHPKTEGVELPTQLESSISPVKPKEVIQHASKMFNGDTEITKKFIEQLPNDKLKKVGSGGSTYTVETNMREFFTNGTINEVPTEESYKKDFKKFDISSSSVHTSVDNIKHSVEKRYNPTGIKFLHIMLSDGIAQGLRFYKENGVTKTRTDEDIINIVAKGKAAKVNEEETSSFRAYDQNSEKYFINTFLPMLNDLQVKSNKDSKYSNSEIIDENTGEPFKFNNPKKFLISTSQKPTKEGYFVSGPIEQTSDGYSRVHLRSEDTDRKPLDLKIKNKHDIYHPFLETAVSVKNATKNSGITSINNNTIVNSTTVNGVRKATVIQFNTENAYQALTPLFDSFDEMDIKAITNDVSNLKYNNKVLENIANLGSPFGQKLVKTIKNSNEKELNDLLSTMINNSNNPLKNSDNMLTARLDKSIPESEANKKILETLINASPVLQDKFNLFLAEQSQTNGIKEATDDDYLSNLHSKITNAYNKSIGVKQVQKPIREGNPDIDYNIINYNDDNSDNTDDNTNTGNTNNNGNIND